VKRISRERVRAKGVYVTGIVSWLKRVPWIVWALIAPAVVIGAVQLWTGGEPRVPVVGAGALAHLRSEDAPEGANYGLDVERRERPERTAERVEEAIRGWPDVLVVGVDASHLEGEQAGLAVCQTLGTLATHAENATAVPVVASLTLPSGASDATREAVEAGNTCWRETVCAKDGLRLCLDLTPHVGDPQAVRDAVGAAVLDALERLAELRASTQVSE